jgi:DNA-binding winged helix-turn-helix (wHTH) protein/tetratricopeptide (TPR) repeat protein
MPQAAASPSSLVRFGVFELNLESGELRKQGQLLKIDEQPLRVLQCLLQRPGQLVTREELRQRLWPTDTFVDFEHGINSTIRRLRQVLGDCAQPPRFIETLPRRGYRFICPVTLQAHVSEQASTAVSRRRVVGLALFAATTAVLVSVGFNTRPRQIARDVATRLHERLLPGEAAKLATAGSVDPALFEALARANYHSAKWTKDGLQKAVRYFQQAIEIDPACAAAWGGLGEAYEALSDWGSRADDEAEPDRLLRRRAEAAFRRAVELDPTLLGSHAALGRMKFAEWKWDEGAREFERAHELNPGHPGFPVYLLEKGQFDEAVKVQQINSATAPLTYNAQLLVGSTAFKAGRYDLAIEALKRTIDLNPDVPLAHYELAWCYAKKAMYPQAISQCDTALALIRRKQPGALVAPSCEWVYALSGRRVEALALARRIEVEGNGRRNLRVAHVYDALGDRARALRYLQKAYDQRAGSLATQWRSPMFSDEIKADPRFQDLIRRTGNPWATFPTVRRGPAAPGNTAIGGQP